MAYPTTLNFQCTTPQIGLQAITDVRTTQQHPLGTIIQAQDSVLGSGEFIYLPGVASTVAGMPVVYDLKAPSTTLALHTSAARGPIAVAMAATVAGAFGWYAIAGTVPVDSGANTVAAGAPAYLTSTAGQIDDAVVVGDKVDGMVTEGANSGGFTYCTLDRPSCNGNG